MKKLLELFVLLGLCGSLFVCLLGCNSNGEDGTTSKPQELYWEIDIYGDFNTYDLERAQQEIPFLMITPAYLPSNLSEYPYIKGPLKGSCAENEVSVLITYQPKETGSKGLIQIIEENRIIIPPDVIQHPECADMEIGETQFVECPDSLPSQAPDGSGDYLGFRFHWNQGNVSFDVGIYGYEQSEAVKIVESMILYSGPVA